MIRALSLSLVLLFCASVARSESMVLAAASTTGVISAAIEKAGLSTVASFGASGVLARQIEQGAPADVFVSANPKWMTYLVDAGLIDATQVRVLMSNSLVLIGAAGAQPITAQTFADRVRGTSFVMADPASAPVGSYGKSALDTLGLWEVVAPSFIPVRNTIATVAAIQSGDAAFGLVYASDVKDVSGVDVLWSIPANSHPPIEYLIAPVAQGDDAAAPKPLIAYLISAPGRALLSDFGFVARTGEN